MDSFLKDFVSQRLTESNLDKLSRNDIPSQKASCLYKETVHSHRRRWHKSIRFLRTHERFLTSKDFSKLVSPSFCTAGIFFTPNENKFVCVTINMMKHVFKLLVFFTDYINVKKRHPIVFFILHSKRYVEVTGI